MREKILGNLLVELDIWGAYPVVIQSDFTFFARNVLRNLIGKDLLGRRNKLMSERKGIR